MAAMLAPPRAAAVLCSASRQQAATLMHSRPLVHCRSAPASALPAGSSSAGLHAGSRCPRRLLMLARAAAAPETAGFDSQHPAAFYLCGSAELEASEATADATLVVEGRRLPAHSQVLSRRSRVLCDLFAGLHEGGGGALSRGCSMQDQVQEVLLETLFEGRTLLDACLFLRCCYRPEDCTPASLAAAPGSLPGLLLLAHRLDAPRILEAACEAMAELAHSATPEELVDWAAAADACQLPELHQRCLSELAGSLASAPGTAFADAALVAERCDRRSLGQLLGVLAAAASLNRLSVSPEALAEALHQPATEQPAAGEAGGSHGLEWTLERYSDQPTAAGVAACSPWMREGGREWRFEVHPGGDTQRTAGHVSVYLRCAQPGTRARFSLTLVDQAAAAGAPEDITRCSDAAKMFDGHGWGWRKFASHQRLRARPGYLAGDRLLLRATVEVV